MDNEKYILAIFPSKYIKTGAHRRYRELVIGLTNRGYKVICFSPKNHFGNRIYQYNHIKINENSIIPITLQLVIQVLTNKNKKILKNNSIIIVFGETTVLSAIVLKKLINAHLILGVRTSVTKDRELAIKSEGLNISKFNLRNIFILKVYLKLFSLYERIMYRYADVITVQNEIDKENVLSITQNNKNVILIPNNINVHWIEKKELRDKNRSNKLHKIGFIGSLIERKGVYLLLSSYKELIEKGYDLELHIAGEGYLREYIENFKETNNLRKIFLYGYISNPMEFAKDMDLIIVPSLIDSFPNVIFESWYVGTPVIGSKVGGIQYQLKYDKLLFKPDKAEIVNKIIQCLNDDFYKEIRTLNNKRKKHFIFDWVGKYQDIIQSLNNLNRE